MNIWYNVMKKPIEERIIEAACIYWNIERNYFHLKSEEATHVYRKSVIYYLVKKNTTISYKGIAIMFGFLSHQPVMRSVDNIEAQINIYKSTKEDVNMILNLAEKLNAKIIMTNINIITDDLDT